MTREEKEKVINKWWKDNYNQLKVNVWKVCGYSQAAYDKWGDDIIPYAFEAFRKMDLDKQYEIITEGNPENYITRGMALSIKSSTSMFYSTYRRFSRVSNEFSTHYHDKEWEEEWQEREKQIDKAKKAINDLDFYDRYLINEYYIEGRNAYEISKKTGIAASTIGNGIKKALKRLKIILEDKYNIEF